MANSRRVQKQTRVAIYARVSTEGKGQDTANQVFQLHEYCERQGWSVIGEYIDHITGKHTNRDGFKRLFTDASQRRFDIVLVWSLDRLTREGVYEAFEHIRRLNSYGVQFESFTEAHFRTTGPAGELMLAISAWIAKQERIRISERTKAGVQRAKREGKHCGRPARVFRRDLALEMHRAGSSYREIGKALGVSYVTVLNAVKKASSQAA
jgi:DNA invertase Pin-like site-specific DNA recombinase